MKNAKPWADHCILKLINFAWFFMSVYEEITVQSVTSSIKLGLVIFFRNGPLMIMGGCRAEIQISLFFLFFFFVFFYLCFVFLHSAIYTGQQAVPHFFPTFARPPHPQSLIIRPLCKKHQLVFYFPHVQTADSRPLSNYKGVTLKACSFAPNCPI